MTRAPWIALLAAACWLDGYREGWKAVEFIWSDRIDQGRYLGTAWSGPNRRTYEGIVRGLEWKEGLGYMTIFAQTDGLPRWWLFWRCHHHPHGKAIEPLNSGWWEYCGNWKPPQQQQGGPDGNK